MFWLSWSLLASADPASFVVPVSGVLTDNAGAPAQGAQLLTFRLQRAVGETVTPLWEDDLWVAFSDGAFTAALGSGSEPLTLDDVPATGDLQLVVIPQGGVASAPVSVGWAPRAARASEADHLGGRGPDDYVRGDYTVGNLAGQVPISNSVRNVDLNADLLDGRSAGNASGEVPISNGVRSVDLNADMVDGRSAGNASGEVPISNGVRSENLNADMVDGRSAGNASGEVPISNGVRSVDLNADLLDGLDASALVQRSDLGTSLGGVATSGANLLNISATWLTNQIDARLTALGFNTSASTASRVVAASGRFDKLALWQPAVSDYVSVFPYKRSLWAGPYVKLVSVANNAGPSFPAPSPLSIVEWDWVGDETWNNPQPPSGFDTVWAHVTLSMYGSSNHSPCFWFRREFVPSSGAAFQKMAGDPDVYAGCVNLSTRTNAPASVDFWTPWWKTNLSRAGGFGGNNQRLLVSVETDYDPDPAGTGVYFIFGGLIELHASDTSKAQTFSTTTTASGSVLSDWRRATLP